MDFVPLLARPSEPSPAARVFLCGENQLLLRRAGTGLDRLPRARELARFGLEDREAQMLGRLEGEAALVLPWPEPVVVPEDFEKVGLRALWSQLNEQLFAIAGRAQHLAHFARTHRFCGRCGHATERSTQERAVRCPRCEAVSYPRISPAIITLVRRGDEALLADSGRFPVPMFSTLAGFCEIGESLEQTLAREVREEVGIEVKNVRYFGSQPWPFPDSLMVGFTAEYASGEVQVDGVELREARFFSARELPNIPPKLSIARALMDAWVRGVTGAETQAG